MAKNYTILIIDGSPDQPDIPAVFEQPGCRMLTAANEKQGFEIARRELPDLIIGSALSLNDDGGELRRLLRADARLHSVPVLLVASAGVRGIAIDTAERARTEAALRESEERFRAQFNGIPTPTFIWRKVGDDFVLANYNDAAMEITQGGVSGIVGKKLSEVYYETPQVSENVQRCFDEKTIVKHEGLYNFRSISETKYLDASYVFVPPNIVMIHARDITEQKRAEKLLRKSEKRFELVALATNDALWDWDLTTDSVWYSEDYYKLFGCSPEEVEPDINLWREAIHPDDKARVVAKTRAVIESGKNYWTDEYRLRSADGSDAYIFDRGYVVYDDDGKPLRMIGAAVNITDRKLAEQVTQANQARLEKQNRVLNELTKQHKLFHEPLETAIREITEIAAQTLETERVSVWLYADHKSKIKAIDLYESSPDRHSENFELTKLDYPKYFQALAKDEAIAAHDAHTDSRTREFSESYLKPLGITSMLDVPIRFGGQVVGVICHEHIGAAREWKLDEQNFVGSMASLVSLLLEANERRQTENALRESQEHLALAQQVGKVGSFELNLRTLAVTVSSEMKTLYGVSSANSFRRLEDWSKYFHPTDAPRVEREIAEAAASGEFKSEFRILLADGSTRWIFGNGKVFYDADKNPLRLVGVNIDVTERKEAEESIRFQAHLLDTVEQAVIATDLNGIVTYWNRFAHRLYGWTAAEAVGQNIILLTIPEIRRKQAARIISRLSLGKSRVGELLVQSKDGRSFPAQIFSSPVNDAAGKLIGIVGTSIDISERKQAEESLSQSENRLRAIVDTEPECVKLLGMNGELLEMNRAGLAMIEADSLEQVIGGDVSQIVAPEHREAFSALTKRVLKGESGTMEYEIIGLKGTRRCLETHAVPLRNQSSEITSLLALTRDITGREAAAAALIEANERAIREYDRLLQRIGTLAQRIGAARDLATIFNAILDFARSSVPCSALTISLYDKEQNTRKVIYVWYNGKEEQASSIEPIPVAKGPVGQAVKSGDVIIVNDYQKSVGKKPTNVYFGYDEDSRDPRSIIVAPMKIMGDAVGVIEIQSYELAAYTQEHATAMRMAANLAANAIENVRLLDLEKQNAEQLRQSQKLESVGRLAGGIAHDFNNMLTAINGYSDLTLRRLKADDPLRRFVEEIKKAGERSADLTNQLLAFSRQQVLKPKILEVNQIVTETSAMLQRLIGEDVQLNISLDSKLGSVEADPGQLTQVIMNLAVNARDAMPHGGKLTIETRNVYLDEEYAARHVPTQPGSYILLAVSDTGTGIDDETRQHIFEPFFTTKQVGKGTGLGLATVYGIVKQSGGYIWIYSEVNIGTTFKVYLPRVDDDAALLEKTKLSEAIPNGTETILLVEDEDIVRNLSRQILEACGYAVVEASNGIEALEVCAKQACKIDLLMTDVVMPQMGGRELSEKLAETNPRIRVLFTSGYTDDAVIRQGVIEVGANFIQKPFTFDSLARKIREVLDKKR